jgi:acylpyruvate hydrolase
MQIATVRTESGTSAARREGDDLVLLRSADVGELLARDDLGTACADETGAVIPVASADFATLVTRPPKVFCVGLNYRDHILETGHEIAEFPTLFAKFSTCLIGAFDDLAIPAVARKPDWEVELGIVIGRPIHRGTTENALDAIAGYTVVNDISMRDWQRRTDEFLQGKTFDYTTPVGPYLVTLDEFDDPFDLAVRCEVDGVVMQQSRTSELVFGPREIVAYCSQIVTLLPGDLIATGTPGGVGDRRDPPIYLEPGQILTTAVEGIGECVNRIVAEKQ